MQPVFARAVGLPFGVPQPRRSASRNRAVESALGEEDSSVSFNGAELTAELSPTLRPKASLIGKILHRLFHGCTAKIPERTNTANFPARLAPKSLLPSPLDLGNQTQGTFLPSLAKIRRNLRSRRERERETVQRFLRKRSRHLAGCDVLSRVLALSTHRIH